MLCNNNSGGSQVQFLSKDSIASLLPKVIPQSWNDLPVVVLDPTTSSFGLSSDWLRDIWIHLRTHHPSDLSRFSGLHILPISVAAENSHVRLISLQVEGCAVLRSAIGMNLAGGLVNVIEHLDGHVVDDLPEYARDHATVVGGYIKIPMAKDTIEVRKFISQFFYIHWDFKGILACQ